MTPRLFQILSIAAVALTVFPGQVGRVSPSDRASGQDALLQRRSPLGVTLSKRTRMSVP